MCSRTNEANVENDEYLSININSFYVSYYIRKQYWCISKDIPWASTEVPSLKPNTMGTVYLFWSYSLKLQHIKRTLTIFSTKAAFSSQQMYMTHTTKHIFFICICIDWIYFHIHTHIKLTVFRNYKELYSRKKCRSGLLTQKQTKKCSAVCEQVIIIFLFFFLSNMSLRKKNPYEKLLMAKENNFKDLRLNKQEEIAEHVMRIGVNSTDAFIQKQKHSSPRMFFIK